MPKLSQFASADKILKYAALLVMGKNLTSALYNDTPKREKVFEKKNTIKTLKITKRSPAYKS